MISCHLFANMMYSARPRTARRSFLSRQTSDNNNSVRRYNRFHNIMRPSTVGSFRDTVLLLLMLFHIQLSAIQYATQILQQQCPYEIIFLMKQ